MAEATILLSRAASIVQLVGVLAFLVASVWLSAVDIVRRRLPNRLLARLTALTLGPLVIGCLIRLFGAGRALALEDLLRMLGGAALLFAFFAVLWSASPRSFGGGDVKVAPLVGGVLGFVSGFWAVIVCAAVAFACAAIWGAVLRGAEPSGNGAEPRTVPFAVCLFAGAWVVILAFPFVVRALAPAA